MSDTSYVQHVHQSEVIQPLAKVNVERNSRGHTYSVEVVDTDDERALERALLLMGDLSSVYGPEEGS